MYSSYEVDAIADEWHIIVDKDPTVAQEKKDTRPIRMRHARENQAKVREAVQHLEMQLKVMTPWTPDMPEWKNAAALVSKRRYQRALDELEALVVSRMFELTKMNIAQTGKLFLFR